MKNERLLNAIGSIDDQLIYEAAPKGKAVRKYFSIKKAVAVFAAMMVLFTLSVPVLAAARFEPAYDVLYMLFPAIAQKLKPVDMSCEDNGIRFAVLSAYVENNEAVIYVAVQDLLADRIDETTELFDSYSINTPFDCSSSCANIGYDAETKTATFLISITQMNEQDIVGDKITLRAQKLLSNKKEYDAVLPDFDINAISLIPETIAPTHIFGSGGIHADASAEDFRALKTTGVLYTPVEGVDITAMGYVDGRLHIQVQYENALETDNHGYIYFRNDKGEEIRCATRVAFSTDSAHQGRYEEYIYDVAKMDMTEYEAYGYFVTSDTLITGNWNVTFPLECGNSLASS